MKIDVSIIIVNYNTAQLTRNCLESILRHTKDIMYEIIISDNGSTDGSVDMIKKDYPQVILLENNANLGFGAANNRGLAIAKGKYILYLNSDTILLNNAVKFFYDYWENSNEQLGALGTNLLDANLRETTSFAPFPTYFGQILLLIKFIFDSIGVRSFYRTIRKKNNFVSQCSENRIVDSVCGADLFVKNNLLAKFDEAFFMYFEETDMQYNMKQKGLISKIISTPQIIHYAGGSDSSQTHRYSFKKKSSLYGWDSCLKYFKKNNYNVVSYFILKILIKGIYLLPGNHSYYKNNRNLVLF